MDKQKQKQRHITWECICGVVWLIFKIIVLVAYISLSGQRCLSCKEFSDTIPSLALATLVFSCGTAFLCFVASMNNYNNKCFNGWTIVCWIIEWSLSVILWIVTGAAVNQVDGCCDTNAKNIKDAIKSSNGMVMAFVVLEAFVAMILGCIKCCAWLNDN